MEKNKTDRNLKLMIEIIEGKEPVHTTKKSPENIAMEANRPEKTYYRSGKRGRMLTQKEMGILRRWQQIWPGTKWFDELQKDADHLRCR